MNKEYGSIQIEIPEPFRQQLLDFEKALFFEEDLIRAEDNPHVTVKFGIKTDDIEEIAEKIAPFIPIRLMFGITGLFMSDDERKSDVIYIMTYSQSVNRMRKRIVDSLDVKEEKIVYAPHLTLGHVKPKSGLFYVGDNPILGEKIVVNQVVWSPKEGDKKIITTDGQILDYEISRQQIAAC